MMRARLPVIGALSVVLGVFALLAARSSAGPITLIKGSYSTVAPAGTGIDDVFASHGSWIPYFPAGTSGLLTDLEVKRAGAFPAIDITDPTGGALIGLLVPGDPTQMAIFDLPTRGANWCPMPAGCFVVDVMLESNTIRGLDLSLFARGGKLDFATTGVTVDPATNTATVSDMATGSFSLTPVPEPTTALLAVIGGSVGLVWLWGTRRRQLAV